MKSFPVRVTRSPVFTIFPAMAISAKALFARSSSFNESALFGTCELTAVLFVQEWNRKINEMRVINLNTVNLRIKLRGKFILNSWQFVIQIPVDP